MVVTQADIAKRMGITRATVSRALRGVGTISPETCEEIKRVAQKMGYQPNVLAQRLKVQKTKILGMVFNTTYNPFFFDLMDAIRTLAHDQGYELLIESKGLAARDENAGMFLGGLIDGLFIAAPNEEVDLRDRPNPVPVVAIDCEIKSDEDQLVDRVVVDRVAGFAEATEYLLAQGRRRVGLVTFADPVVPLMSETKIEGWKSAYRNHGLPEPPESWIIRHPGLIAEDIIPQADVITNRIIEAIPDIDGLVFVADDSALAVMPELLAKGYRIPEDIAVIGTRNIPYCNLAPVKLASLAYPVKAMAREAVIMMFDRLNEWGKRRQPSRCVTLQPKLVLRQSCG